MIPIVARIVGLSQPCSTEYLRKYTAASTNAKPAIQEQLHADEALPVECGLCFHGAWCWWGRRRWHERRRCRDGWWWWHERRRCSKRRWRDGGGGAGGGVVGRGGEDEGGGVTTTAGATGVSTGIVTVSGCAPTSPRPRTSRLNAVSLPAPRRGHSGAVGSAAGRRDADEHERPHREHDDPETELGHGPSRQDTRGRSGAGRYGFLRDARGSSPPC